MWFGKMASIDGESEAHDDIDEGVNITYWLKHYDQYRIALRI